jgi:hypothetical protein
MTKGGLMIDNDGLLIDQKRYLEGPEAVSCSATLLIERFITLQLEVSVAGSSKDRGAVGLFKLGLIKFKYNNIIYIINTVATLDIGPVKN